MSRVVVVPGATGAAGAALCALLASRGDIVVAAGRDAARLAAVQATQRTVCDLTDAAAVTDLAATVIADHGRVDGVVHLVGGWRAGSSAEDWAWLEPRLLGSLRAVTLAFRESLSASDAGRLVTVGSISAQKPTWSNANYVALKTAADAWTTALASGWRKAGTAAAVTFAVSSIGDGGVAPDRLARAIATVWDSPASELNGARIPIEP
ncbi:MAG: oxidoreductase [Glaciihabitans sp.]|nr:oxidoreductase [Glaciihabitans sp.]